MRRPYRTLSSRLKRRLVAFAAGTSPRVRRLLRVTGEWRPPRGSAEVVTSFDAWAEYHQLAEQLLTLLAQAGIESVHFDRPGDHLVAIAERDREQFLTLLREAPTAQHWWLAAPGQPARTVQDRRLARSSRQLRLFRRIAAPDGTRLANGQLSVLVQFWAETPADTPRMDGGEFPKGSLVAPKANGFAPYLRPDQWRRAQADPLRHTERAEMPHLMDFTDPVDVVYTWVNDADPEWQARRAAAIPQASGLSGDALDPARTTNRDELRYSLRSIAMYASWVRHIWIVTDGQVPAWLDLEHPSVTVVTHRELFEDPTALPTFNSHAIEAQLHRIPGLAEHYLYLNDDVFFGRAVRPSLFFHGNGIPKFAVSPFAIDLNPVPVRLNGAALAARNNRDLLVGRTGRTATRRMQHTPHPLRRSSMQRLAETIPHELNRVAQARFRTKTDLSLASDLGHYWAFADREAVTGHIGFRYVDIGSSLAAEHLNSLLSRRDQNCFCLNDVGGYDTPPDDSLVTHFLQRYFPLPSPFERPEA